LSDLHNKGVTIIVITHDLNEAKALGARIVALDSRKKKQIQEHAQEQTQDEKLENACENGNENKNKSLLSLFNTRIIL
ncbi:hypothetical protein QP631_12500, partial [Staphylococcus lugdunensis]